MPPYNVYGVTHVDLVSLSPPSGKAYGGEKSLVDAYKTDKTADASLAFLNTIVAAESVARKLYAAANVLPAGGVS